MSNVSTMEKNGLQWWQDAKQLEIVRNVILSKKFHFTDLEFRFVIEFARKYQLDPFMRQVTAWKDKDNKIVTFVTYAGLLKIAHSSGLFDGMSEIEFGKDERGEFGKVSIFRKGCVYPFVTKLYKKEWVKTNYIWKEKEIFMFCKTIEAVGLRKTFPELSDIYIIEENWLENEDEKELIDVTPKKEHQKDLPEKSQKKEPKKTKPLEEKTEEELMAAIEKDLSYLEYDEIEDAILNTKCVTLLEVAQVTRKLAMRKYRNEPNWLASEFFNVSRDKYAIQAKDTQEELEFQDEIPY